jgi:hypothetical protein
MPGSLESSLEGLFGEGGLFEDEALAEKKQLATADWIEPDAVALSPDDPDPHVTGQGSTDLLDPSEVLLDSSPAPPLELDELKNGDGL